MMTNRNLLKHTSLAIACVLAISACNRSAAPPASTADVGTTAKPAVVAEAAYPESVYWGDEHVHTGLSMDAGLSGTTLMPEDAVRFARGEEVRSTSGVMMKLSRPMDWVAVTDHSDALGTITELQAGNPIMMANPIAKRWHDLMLEGGESAMQAKRELVKSAGDGTAPMELADPKFMVSAWQKTVDVMEKYNDPGKFTAFISYEWSSGGKTGQNLHRNIIFRENADKTRDMLPLTTNVSAAPGRDGTDSESLYAWLSNWEAKTGGKVLAIPHNGNLSNGWMFRLERYDGTPMTTQYATDRQRWERLYELYQYKGSSEAHPSLAPSDELSNFGIWDTADLGGNAKTKDSTATEYWRDALLNGMKLENVLGSNPFKLGAAAGTDTHTGIAGYEEKNFGGKFVDSEAGNPKRWSNLYKKEQSYIRKDWTLMAQGITGVWSTANTRGALWDAMYRRETYASSGPRITLRVFGGFDFAAADAKAEGLATRGYAKGVPMGGDLKAAPAGKVPVLLIAAMKDPDGANLDRVQVVKGWVDASGQTQQKVYDVKWSGDRKVDAKGKLPPVGNTVDLTTATYSNSIGAAELLTAWTDPTFDASQKAFYYVRAVEIPTPRWTAHDAVKFKVKMAPEVEMLVQERAVSSPIWYSPK